MRLSPTVSQEKQEKKENVNISKTVSQYPLRINRMDATGSGIQRGDNF